MPPDERWRKVEEIFQGALEREGDDRLRFIAEACAGDEDLRAEVESLLEHDRGAGEFLATPVVDTAAPGSGKDRSFIGHTLGSYQVLTQIGAGGMGEVYLAQDARLGRRVALKVLSRALYRDPQRRDRFAREAKAASALNHPNIVTVYDVGSDRGSDFIVMEYVAGKTLGQLIAGNPMPVAEALHLALQIADALAAAHRAAIVHRDIKPGNIMVTESGLVKVVDFGIAKLTNPVGEAPQTVAGAVIGTAAYMSPEQASGGAVDARSDIFSFGAVLYEMLAGRPAFGGEGVLGLPSILHDVPPPIGSVRGGVPAALERIVARCLEKDRAHRYESGAELRRDLATLHTSPASPRSMRLKVAIVSAVAILLAIAGLAAWKLSPTPDAGPRMTIVPFTSSPGLEENPAFSPDGRQVAFTWSAEIADRSDLYVKLIGAGDPLRLAMNAVLPAWSPDGRWIAFYRGERGSYRHEVWIVPALGGTARKIGEFEYLGWVAHWVSSALSLPDMEWTKDGKSLIVPDLKGVEAPGLVLLSLETGEKRLLTRPPPGTLADTGPALSPDGRTLAFIRNLTYGAGNVYLAALSRDGSPIGDPKQLTFESHVAKAIWLPGGNEILYNVPNGATWSWWRISTRGAVKARPALPGIGPDLALSPTGDRLVYSQTTNDTDIWRLALKGHQEPSRFISSTQFEGVARYSSDGRKIAFASRRSGDFEIWVADGDGSNPVQLTSMGAPMTGSPRCRRMEEMFDLASPHGSTG